MIERDEPSAARLLRAELRFALAHAHSLADAAARALTAGNGTPEAAALLAALDRVDRTIADLRPVLRRLAYERRTTPPGD